MQYLYHDSAGEGHVELSGDAHRYMFRVRRHRAGETIYLRNLRDQMLYRYEIVSLEKKSAMLMLLDSKEWSVKAKKYLHLGWCMIDTKMIEKMLPSLNEIGIAKITFLHCARSQKSFRPDFKRMEKILLNSSQQCGRSVMMELEEMESLERFLACYPESWMLNFSEKSLEEVNGRIETLLVGAEGGFSEEECTLLKENRIVGLDTPLVLRSESAVCAAAAKIIL